jgi:aerobic carbon-monoxide dehydrogenase small subunit
MNTSVGSERVHIRVTVNGQLHEREVEARQLLVDLLRETLELTGTHIGCDTSYCGACTVLLNGEPVKSCTMFAFQADGAAIMTVEGLSQAGNMHPLQTAFTQCHALQCGYCTPGFLMSSYALLSKNPRPTNDAIRKALAGNTCRCTGYQNIFKAVAAATESLGAPRQ